MLIYYAFSLGGRRWLDHVADTLMSILGQNQLQKLGNRKQRPAKEESHWGGKAGSKKRIQCRPACSDRTLGASWLTCTWGRENMNKVQDCQGVKLLKNPRYLVMCLNLNCFCSELLVHLGVPVRKCCLMQGTWWPWVSLKGVARPKSTWDAFEIWWKGCCLSCHNFSFVSSIRLMRSSSWYHLHFTMWMIAWLGEPGKPIRKFSGFTSLCSIILQCFHWGPKF